MGKNKNDNKISLTQLVLLGLGSLIGSLALWSLGSIFSCWTSSHYLMGHRLHSYWNDFL